MRPIAWLVLLSGAVAAGVQQPLSVPSSAEGESTDEYQFKWPVQRVAIIGAGSSGLIAYRELTRAGLDVRIFERDNVPGGNWYYTEEIPLNAPVPNAPTPIADYVPSFPPEGVDLPYSETLEDDGEIWRDHRAPKPIWASLTSNSPSPVQQFPQWPWPPGTPWELSQDQLRNYIRSYASYLNVNSNDDNPATAYRTRVEHVEKRINQAGEEQGWRLWLRSLEPTGGHVYNATWWTEDFDAVVVAVGELSAPSVPPIPGLEEWARKFPNLVRHSRQYRRPEAYVNQTVLIIGAAMSGSEISRDLNRHVRQIYQSFRPDTVSRPHFRTENFLRRIPRNTTFVGEINRFLPVAEGAPVQTGLVELKNGTILSGIDRVILATGFRYSYPFLPQYYDGATYLPHEGSAKVVSPFLPVDGTHVRDLYLDVFYIRDPTLAFLGATVGIQPFLFSEYHTLALAKVWTNAAKLPTIDGMHAFHEKTIEGRGGYGRHAMFLSPEQFPGVIRHLIGWLNQAAVKYGGRQVDGIGQYQEINHYWRIARFGGRLKETLAGEDEEVLAPLGLAPVGGDDKESEYDLIYDDGNW